MARAVEMSAAGVDSAPAKALKLKRSEVVRLLGELSDLLAAGCPLARALKVLNRQSRNPRLSAITDLLEKEIVNGASLADALAASGNFTPVHVAMVRAAEAGGFLRQTLSQMASAGRRRMELLSRVRAAVTYPSVLMTVAIASVVFLLSFVVPSFTAVYQNAGVKLPWATRFLMGVSDVLNTWWLLILAFVIVLVGIVRLLLRNDALRRSIDAGLMKLPLIGPVMYNWAMSEFARSMAMLLTGGVRALDALVLSASSTGNRALRAALEDLADSVRSGRTLGQRMLEQDIFDPSVSELIVIAEESGKLGEVMATLAEQSYKRFSDRVDVLVALIEPAIVIVVAAIVALVVAAMLLPVLLMNTLVG